MTDYRHECKHILSAADLPGLRRRLQAVAQPDRHGTNGRYLVRSLYFDTPGDRALWEKLDGAARREKFRIRYYDLDPALIHLEKKCKWNSLGWKESVPLAAEQVQELLDGHLEWMARSPMPLVGELYREMRGRLLRLRTIVDYTREAYVFGPGNVRVTLDSGLRAGVGCAGFLRRDCATVPAGDVPAVLEVKWDAVLPEIIRDAVQLEGRRTAAFSKYAACRGYF